MLCVRFFEMLTSLSHRIPYVNLQSSATAPCNPDIKTTWGFLPNATLPNLDNSMGLFLHLSNSNFISWQLWLDNQTVVINLLYLPRSLWHTLSVHFLIHSSLVVHCEHSVHIFNKLKLTCQMMIATTLRLPLFLWTYLKYEILKIKLIKLLSILHL